MQQARLKDMKRMMRCKECKAYTLDAIHCGAPTCSPHPPKFSIDDKYAAYRRQAMLESDSDG